MDRQVGFPSKSGTTPAANDRISQMPKLPFQIITPRPRLHGLPGALPPLSILLITSIRGGRRFLWLDGGVDLGPLPPPPFKITSQRYILGQWLPKTAAFDAVFDPRCTA